MLWLIQKDQMRPMLSAARKSTPTLSRGDTAASFIHGKDRMPQRSTLCTVKVLAFTPHRLCGVERYRELRNATRSDSS